MLNLNPYQRTPPPFAGRRAALVRLKQGLAERLAVLYSGRRSVGKTALLQYFEATFDDTHIGVYLALRETPVQDETDWLLTLSQAITAEVVRHDLTYTRLAGMPPPGDDPRGWFDDVFLRDILSIIRPHRRLVLLLDDVEALLDAITAEKLPADSIAYLAAVMARHEQIGMAVTLDASREADLARLQPLIHVDEGLRLTNLTREECRALLQNPVAALYTLPEETIDAVYEASGGVPSLAQMFGDAFYRRWEASPELNLITAEDVRTLSGAVYAGAGVEFHHIWNRLSLNERLVLTAMSSLFYADPLRAITTAAIESWLVNTDYPMDSTTINAALRSLQYDELVGTQPLTLQIGLFQRWLVENARLDAVPARSSALPTQNERRWWLVVAALMLVIIGAVLLARLGSLPEPPPTLLPEPTVTLVDPTP